MAEHGSIEGKTFLITGGASGLGALYAEAFLKEGAKNVALLDIAVETGKATSSRLNATYGDKTIFIKCDVNNEEDITAAFDKVVKEFEQIDVIINNAGIMVDSPEVWRIASNVNWQGLVSFSMKGLKHMRKDKGGAGGTIVNISSTAALSKFRQLPIYSGSKMAVLHFSFCLSTEPFFENTEVRVLTLCPGATATPLLHNLETRGYDEIVNQELFELGHLPIQQKPESVATAMVKMFKEGGNGTIWLSVHDKPVKNITDIFETFFKELEPLYTQL